MFRPQPQLFNGFFCSFPRFWTRLSCDFGFGFANVHFLVWLWLHADLAERGELVSWDQQFFDPIILPGRKPLVTLRNAALYITKLPKAEHDAEEWQAAMAALLLVAEHDGPTMFARIGVMRALNRHVERVFDTSRKDHNWGG